jgi:predicted enzyme related to lactoylglutathione lyase
MSTPQPNRLVHLELHTHDLPSASAFYAELLLWRTEQIDVRWGTYHALGLGGGWAAGSSSAVPGARGGSHM